MTRGQKLLAAALVLQAILIVLARSPFSGASASAEPRLLLPDLAAWTPTRIDFEQPDEKSITLLRDAENWTVTELEGFPADATKVESLLEDLEGLQVRRPVVSSSRSHGAFKVKDDDFEARIKIWEDGGDDPRVDLVLGSSPNYRLTHMRLSDDDRVYEVRGLATYDVRADASVWADKQLLNVDEEAITGLKLSNAEGSFELSREDETWTIVAPSDWADKALDQEKLDALLAAAGSINLSDPVGPVDEAAHGFDDAAATLELRWRPAAGDEGSEASGPEQETVVRIGSKPGDQDTKRYITRAGFGFSGTVWSSSVSKLLEQTISDLVGT